MFVICNLFFLCLLSRQNEINFDSFYGKLMMNKRESRLD